MDAYMKPQVDNNKTPFKWGFPDLDRIRTFLMVRLRWSQAKIDEVLLPILQNLNKKNGSNLQSNLEQFFSVEKLQRRREIQMGKRLKEATEKLKEKSNSAKRQKR
ncbi:unnamed protein product [Ambrosiozyma monospora]|uniref:Unnamed protein product n=1 Tax=Ambrosiozyma monospora TaxID=43982 RepID=A0ACB5T3J8_AMBMO|nr:unnamed protein product [Ambrosiozyma monospora]